MDAKNLIFTKSKGTGAIATGFTQNQRFRLVRVELHLSSAPTTSGDLTVTSRVKGNANFDTVSYKRDLSVGSVTDLVIPFGEGYEYDAHDEVDVDYTNADLRTYGCRIVTELL